MESIFGDVISIYTRAQALADGVLFDVSSMAKEAGFKFPVAITSELNEVINSIPEVYSYQDREGRLWDVLYMAALHSKRSGGQTVLYKVIMYHEVEARRGKKVIEELKLKAVIGPGDNMEPVITIMLPYES